MCRHGHKANRDSLNWCKMQFHVGYKCAYINLPQLPLHPLISKWIPIRSHRDFNVWLSILNCCLVCTFTLWISFHSVCGMKSWDRQPQNLNKSNYAENKWGLRVWAESYTQYKSSCKTPFELRFVVVCCWLFFIEH